MAKPLMPKKIGVRPLLKGKSAFLESLEKHLDKDAMASVIEQAAEPIAEELTEDLRERARALLDWAPYAKYLEVKFVELRFRVVAGEDPDVQQAIHKLEYGFLAAPPKPLLRTFQKDIEKAYKKLANQVSEVVMPSKSPSVNQAISAVTAVFQNA
jgi:deoxyadenosine/deoxycytidine kinase